MVPALIGIGPVGNFLTEIHTHDASGIIYVESPTETNFTTRLNSCSTRIRRS
jgi:hypothetical protein